MFYAGRFFVEALIVIAIWVTPSTCSFADFSLLSGRSQEPTCVDIPKNMSLCADIGYNKMRLPNLLNHDTLMEVQQQSGSWVPLLNVRCHPHTKVFLCSLFTPVCLENQIFPCRSLCLEVQKSCEGRMLAHGYHWPDMLRCDKFPQDNDMCIKAPSEVDDVNKDHSRKSDQTQVKNKNCAVCSTAVTYEDILSKFCEADVVLKAKLKRQRGQTLRLARPKIFKASGRYKKPRKVNSMLMRDEDNCCVFKPGQFKYLFLAKKFKRTLQPISILRWNDFKGLTKSEDAFRNINCTSLKTTDSKISNGGVGGYVNETANKKKKGKKKSRKVNNKRARKNKRKEQKKGRKRKRDKQNKAKKNRIDNPST